MSDGNTSWWVLLAAGLAGLVGGGYVGTVLGAAYWGRKPRERQPGAWRGHHYRADGAWWRPFDCLNCHPAWYYASMVLPAVLVVGILIGVR